MKTDIMYQEYGFCAPQSGLAYTAEEAIRIAEKIGFPVVMKVVSPDIIHKTDVGGVELGLGSPMEVKAAFSRIEQSVRKAAPEARIEGISVEEMISEGIEIIIGLNNDRQFGPIIMFGLGGIFTEILQDVAFRVLPISREDAASMLREIKGREILSGYRGNPPVSREMLIELLMRANDMGLALAERLDFVDLNPIAVWGDQHCVLDAKILLRDEPDERQTILPEEPNISHLSTFFKASSVALVGASATPGKIGNAVLDSLVNHDYQGQVYPINPKRTEVMGLTCYPSLSEVPGPVGLVVVTVALSRVPDLIRECASKGVHNMVIISGGGKELGGQSEELESTIARLAAENDIRIIGCNCIGVFDGETRLDTFFQVHERMVRPRQGPVAMLTQSGTVGAAFLEAVHNLGMSKFVSYGNRIDVDEADLIAYLADDPATEIIVCYIEGFDKGRKFLTVAKKVSQKKPIVIFKSGRTRRAATASLSHTGFFGGTHGVVVGALGQAGLIAVDSLEELLAVTKALALQPRARGPRVAMISNGAGTMVQGIDLLSQYGLEIPPLSSSSVEKLKKVYPPYFVVQNPVDVTGSATSADYKIGIETLLQDPNVDIVMPWFVFQDTPLEENIVDVLGELSQRYDKPILCGAVGGPYTVKMAGEIEEVGVPVFLSVRLWITAAWGLGPSPA